ncbi:COMM domain-containing protein 2 [Eucyclogobius newberryi]|uniref:COMM domain-containing protein 2 n=1 Tax=Eucyclogobius newberryi TaxID=166745 RepID=UPI003B5AED6F
MLLVLSEQHKGHLSYLSSVEPEVVAEFGRIAVDFLRRGTSPKIYEAAARKLGASVEQVQCAVEGLMFLVLESCRHTLSETDFMDSVLVLGFSQELNDTLLQLYLQQGGPVRSVLAQLGPSLPVYHSLEWRLDVNMSSRALRQQLCPVMTLCLSLTRGGASGDTRKLLQARPGTVLHLLSVLEPALDAMKSTHTRRILRNIK